MERLSALIRMVLGTANITKEVIRLPVTQINKKCKKCFLSPDMCGAKYDKQKCSCIYENKWHMFWDEIRELVVIAMLIVFVFVFLILSILAVRWYLSL